MSTINVNQFAQVPVRGETDLQIAKSGIITGIISPNQATPLKAGDAVMLDPAITAPGTPAFIGAGVGDVALGYMILDPKAGTASAPESIQVALRLSGPVIWLVANGTIPPGSLVEQAPANDVQVLAAGKLRGLALDYAVAGQLLRVILAPALV